MDMMLNSLPSRTWNRLGINESFIKIEKELKNHTPEMSWNGTNALWNPNAGAGYTWTDLESGMGKDVCTLTQNAEIGLIKTVAGEKMTTPMLLKYTYENGENSMSRLCFHAEKDSRLSVLVLLESNDKNDNGISVIQTKIIAEEGAEVNVYVAQLLGSNYICLNDIGGVSDDNAVINITKLELGSKELYAGTYIDLKGLESAFNADIGYHVIDGQKVDMNYVADHHGAKSNSLMEISGTLEDGAHKVFRGSIDFKHGCPGAKGTENENVLLMGDRVINQTIPLILCKEEDVEGNHGASIGRLDEKMLFYLSARGIAEKEAQRIIAQARIDTICNKIPDEDIRTKIHDFEIERGISYDTGK